MRTITAIKAVGDFLYKNTLILIFGGLYIGVYAANLDKLDM